MGGVKGVNASRAMTTGITKTFFTIVDLDNFQ
jgi:hypothetical protein